MEKGGDVIQAFYYKNNKIGCKTIDVFEIDIIHERYLENDYYDDYPRELQESLDYEGSELICWQIIAIDMDDFDLMGKKYHNDGVDYTMEHIGWMSYHLDTDSVNKWFDTKANSLKS